jgi:hypothetical protein
MRRLPPRESNASASSLRSRWRPQTVPVSLAPQESHPRHARWLPPHHLVQPAIPQHSSHSRRPARGQLGCRSPNRISEVAPQPALASFGSPPDSNDFTPASGTLAPTTKIPAPVPGTEARAAASVAVTLTSRQQHSSESTLQRWPTFIRLVTAARVRPAANAEKTGRLPVTGRQRREDRTAPSPPAEASLLRPEFASIYLTRPALEIRLIGYCKHCDNRIHCLPAQLYTQLTGTDISYRYGSTSPHSGRQRPPRCNSNVILGQHGSRDVTRASLLPSLCRHPLTKCKVTASAERMIGNNVCYHSTSPPPPKRVVHNSNK